jgi:hypothetical protein
MFFFVVTKALIETGGGYVSDNHTEFLPSPVKGVMLQVPLMSLLCPVKNDVTLKIIIGLVIDHY